jgi:hypothetical protein
MLEDLHYFVYDSNGAIHEFLDLSSQFVVLGFRKIFRQCLLTKPTRFVLTAHFMPFGFVARSILLYVKIDVT